MRATVGTSGRFSDDDRALATTLGVDQVQVPAHRRVAWAASGSGMLYSITPAEAESWVVELFQGGLGGVRRSALSPENVAAFARSTDFGGTIKNLSASFASASGMTSPIVVLIDPTGDPTFAGGTTQDYRQLAAMEMCRRASAPMAIWQAFEEQRLTVDPHWIHSVMTDDRFTAIRNLLPLHMEDDQVYVAIPLRNDRTVVGVAAGFWSRNIPITAQHVDTWLSLADELSLGIQFSELLRRAQVNGAEAERTRINDDIHAGLAQSIFALSLEIARVSAGRDPLLTHELQTLQAMADELSTDVRGFLSDGRANSAGTNLARQLHELTSDLGLQTGAFVFTDHRVEWDEYSPAFADYIVRVVTEAFRNIIKHSNPSHISFRSRIDVESKDVIIEITDDGRNEPRPRGSSAGVGLALISELTAGWKGQADFEVTEHGATLTIQAMPEYQSEWAVAQRILEAGPDVG